MASLIQFSILFHIVANKLPWKANRKAIEIFQHGFQMLTVSGHVSSVQLSLMSWGLYKTRQRGGTRWADAKWQQIILFSLYSLVKGNNANELPRGLRVARPPWWKKESLISPPLISQVAVVGELILKKRENHPSCSIAHATQKWRHHI